MSDAILSDCHSANIPKKAKEFIVDWQEVSTSISTPPASTSILDQHDEIGFTFRATLLQAQHTDFYLTLAKMYRCNNTT